MIWSETGTRKGAEPVQLASVSLLWSVYGITELHDGDCLGVDEQLYYLGKAFQARVHIHPPTNPSYRAWLGDGSDSVWAEKEYHDRDRYVVNQSDALVACVLKPYELKTGGTWYTINYARSINRPTAIIWPSGHTTYENWDLEKKS